MPIESFHFIAKHEKHPRLTIYNNNITTIFPKLNSRMPKNVHNSYYRTTAGWNCFTAKIWKFCHVISMVYESTEQWSQWGFESLLFPMFKKSKEFGEKLEYSLKQSADHFSEAQSQIVLLQETNGKLESRNRELEAKLFEIIEKEQSAEERARWTKLLFNYYFLIISIILKYALIKSTCLDVTLWCGVAWCDMVWCGVV